MLDKNIIKIVIADDEHWIMNVIKSVILTNAAISVAGEATNGFDALLLCEQTRPDILITDICMPGISGIALIRKVQDVLPDIKVIVISGHDDFEYAQQAIRFGVSDYLLKPIDDHALMESVNKLVVDIAYSHHKKLLSSGEKTDVIDREQMVQAQIIHKLCLIDSFPGESFEGLLKSSRICALGHKICFVLVQISSGCDDANVSTAQALRKDVRQELETTLPGRVICEHPLGENRLIFLEEESAGGLSELLDKLTNILQKRPEHKISVGLSGFEHLDASKDSWKAHLNRTKAALFDAFFATGSGMYIYASPESGQLRDIEMDIELADNIVLAVLSRDSEKINACISQYEMLIQSENRRARIGNAKEILWKMIVYITMNTDSTHSDVFGLYANDENSASEAYRNCGDFYSCCAFARSLFCGMAEQSGSLRKLSSRQLIKIARNYTESRFADNLSLDAVARYVGFHPSYFSEVFKKETGLTYIDYLTKLRLNHAKTLLVKTDMRVSDIAEKSGYPDSKYFSRIFKAKIGSTPGEYRERNTIYVAAGEEL